jgi:hypothetical protein
MRIIQVACVLALAFAVPPPEPVFAAAPNIAPTIVLECDPEECEEGCELNRENCEQQGTITDDCTGDCQPEPIECFPGQGEVDCDSCLTCLIDI